MQVVHPHMIICNHFMTSTFSISLELSRKFEEIYRYGYFETSNSYFRCNDTSTIGSIFARLRNYGGNSEVSNRGPKPRFHQISTITRLGHNTHPLLEGCQLLGFEI